MSGGITPSLELPSLDPNNPRIMLNLNVEVHNAGETTLVSLLQAIVAQVDGTPGSPTDLDFFAFRLQRQGAFSKFDFRKKKKVSEA